MSVRYPEVTVHLTGENGNIFNLLAIVERGLKNHGVARNEIAELRTKLFECDCYEEALFVLTSWVNVE